MTETRALVPHQAAEINRDDVKALADVYLANKPTGEKAVGLFPGNMTPIQATQLARLAMMYGLDPMADELTIYEGRPFVTVAGRLRIANDHPQFDGIEDPREATPQERAAWRCRDEEFLFVATAWRKDRRLPFVGYGRAGGRYERNYLVSNNERGPELARKRAIVNALKMAFSMPLPSAEDDEHWVEARVVERRTIDQHTGEIVEEQASGATAGQIAAIHIAAQKLGLIVSDPTTTYDDSPYRERLMETCGVPSSSELTEGDASAFLSMLQAEIVEQEAASERAIEAAKEATMTAEIARHRAETTSKGKRVRDEITLDPGDEGKPLYRAADAPQRTEGVASAPAVLTDDDPLGIAEKVAELDRAGVAPETHVGPGEIVASADKNQPPTLAAVAAALGDPPKASAGQLTHVEHLLGDVGVGWTDFRDEYPDEQYPQILSDLNVQQVSRVVDALTAKKRGLKP